MPKGRDAAGNVWEYDSLDAQGNPVNARLMQAAAPQMPADPAFPYQGAQAQAQAANTGAEAQVNQATIAAQIAAAEAEATIKQRQAQTAGLPEGQQWNPDGSGIATIPGYTRQGLSPEVRQNAIQAYTDADALDRAADEIEQRFREGPGATSGIRGLQDYLPTDANKVFNDAGQQARGYVKRALGFTGGEGNTVAESSALYDPYLPTAGDRDAQIEAKIRKLRELANDSRTKAVTTLGGRPDGNGNIIPLREEQPNALTQLRIGNPQGLTAAPFGSTQGGTTTIPPEMTQELDALTARLMQQNGGRLDPQAYAREGSAIANKYGFDPGDLAGWATGVNEYLDKGGKTVPSGAVIENRDLSGTEQFRNNLISNPVGAAAVGALDMGGFGGVTALAPEQMAALGEAQPLGMAVGQIGGSIAGTSALARGAKFLAARAGSGVAPRLLGGGAGAQFGRNVAADAGYSGIYGGVTGEDPLESAAWGAAGSAGGQGVGRLASRAIGGVDLAPAVQFLRDRNIPMTVPQQLGGFAKSVEDKAISMPLLGDLIRARRTEGLDAFNREAFNEAGSPIGASVQNIGEEGVQALTDQIGDAYSGATQGMAPVPLDDQFISDIQAVIARGEALPSDYRRTLGSILERRLAPATDMGELTGEGYQQATRGLKSSRAAADKLTPGFENDYRDAISAAMGALDEQILRGGQGEVISRLKAANAANRNMRTIEDAANRAAGGSETGTPFMFTPSQLQRAGMATERRFPGSRPFAELADAGQAVLPSRIPNSGTADRAAQMLLPGAILGGGGLGALSGNDPQSVATGAGTGAGLSTAAMLALLAGGTKTGQRALQRAIIDRPATMKQLGRQIRNRTGLFGSASLPFVISEPWAQ